MTSGTEQDKLRFISTMRRAIKRSDTPFRLASGAMSSVKVDIEELVTKRGMQRYIVDYVAAALSDVGEKIDAVGGPAIGAVPLACGLADRLDADWFYLDKAGVLVAPPARSARVLLIDDVITSGGSLLKVADELQSTGVRVLYATTLLDRGDVARTRFNDRGIEYLPMLTHDDLGLEAIDAPVTSEHRAYRLDSARESTGSPLIS